MAAVYRARDLSLDRECAVKVLHRHLQGDKESRLRFQREAHAVARLRHQGILEIYAYSPEDSAENEDSFLVTEFIHGPTLRAQLLQHRPRFPEIGAMIGSEVARALSIAHREGVIHRDIKPENLMIRRDGSLVLCDFGIARILDKDTVTTTGQLLGSPAYMAPEHIKGQHVDSRSDLFSLGTMMYELITGELPFRGKNPHDTLTRIASGAHTPVCEQAPLCGPELARAVERTLDPNPDTRYQDAEILREDLLYALRESGIEDVRTELGAYFADPQAWETAFAARLKARLIETGLSLRKSRRIAGALSAWGRAEQIDPQDKGVQALLASLARGSRRRRQMFIGLYLICGGGAVAVGGHYLFHHRLGPGRSTMSVERTAGLSQVSLQVPGQVPAEKNPLPAAAGKGAVSEVPPVAHVPLATAPAHPESNRLPPPGPVRVHPAPAPAPLAVHSVRLEPWPKAVRVTHNGKLLGAYGTDVHTVQLAPGSNEFLFENPACYSERVVLPPGITPPEVRVRLRWKPALLLVRAYGSVSPAEDGASLAKDMVTADVLVDGRLVGRSGQVLALPMQGDDSGRAVEVQLSAPGRHTVSRSLTVHANQLSQLDVPLPPM